MTPPSFADPRTRFTIETSAPGDHDGRKVNEPKRLVCAACGAAVELDPDPTTPGIDDLDHKSNCSQRFVRSRWFREQVAGEASD